MGETASRAKLLDPRNRAKVQQAISLIFRGKAGIAGQDPALRPFVNALALRGVVSAQEINRRIQEQKQQEVRIATAERVRISKQAKLPTSARVKPQLGPTRATFEAEQRRRAEVARQKIIPKKKRIPARVVKKLRIAPEPKKPVPRRTVEMVTTRPRVLIRKTRAERGLLPGVTKPFLKSAQVRKKAPRGEVQPVSTPKGVIARKIKELEDLQKVRSTKSIRTRQRNIKNELKLVGLTVGETVVKGVVAFITLPITVNRIRRNPRLLKEIPSKIKSGAEEFGQLIRVSPTEAFAKIGGEIVFLKGAGKTAKVVGKVGGNTAARLNPKFKSVTKGQINLKTTKGTTTIKIGGPVKKIQEPLSKQVRIAGKEVTAVSAQADRLVNFIRKRKIIRKPIPGEANLKPSVKNLLKKFDKKTISKKELIQLQSEVPILERSFFADPRGRFRPSRLGSKQKEASLVDVLSGDVTFRSNKPQILVFDDVRVSKFPKNLADVEKSLKSGKSLTKSQAKRLVDFQVKKTGKFKPIGALTREPEITLAPGEIVKRVKKVGVTLINGKKVDIIQAKVVKATKSTKKLLSKSKKGKITQKELKILRKKLKKESGFQPRLSRSRKIKPRARLPKRVPRRLPRRPTRRPPKLPIKKIPRIPPRKRIARRRRIKPPAKRPTRRQPKRPKKRPTRRTPAKQPKRPVKRPTRRPIKKQPKRPVKRPARRPLARPPRAPPVAPLKIRVKRRKVRVRKKKKGAYNVFARPLKRTKKQKRPKLVKVNKRPLKKSRAKDLRNFITDTSLARTGRIKSTKGKPRQPKVRVPVGYAKKTSKKFRRFRRVKGKKRPLPRGKVIEKRRNLLDTRQEKRKITLRRRIKQITSKPVKRITKKPAVTDTRRQQMLSNLAKARRVRASNLRRRKR